MVLVTGDELRQLAAKEDRRAALARFLANMNARVSPLQHERDRVISELERQRVKEQDPASFHGLS